MANPFGKNGGPANSVPRNTFDLSFQNNLTLPFGALVPCFCKEVLPGDSFRINTTFGLRFMPTAFPLQTRIRADVHFFYVRNRNLWEDWPDFYGKTKSNLSFPVLKGQSSDFYKTGSLADFLGVPSSVYGSRSNFVPVNASAVFAVQDGTQYALALENTNEPFSYDQKLILSGYRVQWLRNPSFTIGTKWSPSARITFTDGIPYSERLKVEFGIGMRMKYPTKASLLFCDSSNLVFSAIEVSVTQTVGGFAAEFDMPDSFGIEVERCYFVVDVVSPIVSDTLEYFEYFTNFSFSASESVTFLDYPEIHSGPYGDSLMLSALPFRAYESIYNSFYRDERNNPFVIDGEKEYNKYLPTKAGGFDSTNYQLRYRNWEQDFLTTCVASPQQGVAPLVGISATGVMSVSDPDTGQVYQVQAQTGDDADTITGFDVTETLPKAVTRSLVNYASSGISINDFRNVNAFQRWLETNIRRGYKYRDQIKSHYDVDISYQELDMPEFIGGVSCDVTPNTVSQTTPTDEPLGSYAGQLYGSGSSKNSVDNYCDEHGFIIGILSVVPVPNYSQLLPKHFLKTDDSLDYYSPEFGHIGMQAVHNQEVAPLQCTKSDLSGVFGYQRAWYDYLQSVDEVHGQFRTTLRDFVMNRVFKNLPALGPSFTVIDPEQLNDVFTVREVDGEPIQPILGQLYFDVQAKRPIPRFGVPRLE
ncbi:MAG: hypothetical protein K2G41_01195 [Duncaniella sp.]|uniref:major capsid protein n=1 Tax=Duncaniella sp. TaxID=2518496 RepID=UPI0023C2C91B|nr:major capsid protein [Duncaniella sp.]MDE6089293.1 hypothetical protein [Duncaniella sp.]